MKKKLTGKYMVVFSVSVFLVISIWLGLVYMLLCWEKNVNETHLQYLINRFDEYVEIDNSDEIVVNDIGKQLLIDNAMWVQVINSCGDVMYEYNVPNSIPKKYDVFQITHYMLNSDRLYNQTLFVKQSLYNKEFGIILGCDSSNVSKFSIRLHGGINHVIKMIIVAFLIVFFVVGIAVGIYFSRTISSPVNEIIENINKLETDENCEMIKTRKSIFKTVADSLENLRKRLRSADEERKYAEKQRNEWISNISHDMKTPLAAIMGYAELMTYENFNATEEDRKVYNKKIYKHAKSISELVEELKFNRLLESGRITLEKEEVNICDLLEECMYALPSNYDTERINYCFDDYETYAVVDRQLIKRCFVNIMSNAVVHNNADVDIIITAKEGERLVVEIEDNGKGVSEEDMKNIFMRYYRGKESSKVAGSGLGLAIANEIVKVHGGNIEVESELGKGTKFVITI